MQTKASASITAWTTIASGYTYEPFGAVDAIAQGNGLSVANTWGLDGTLASRRLYRTAGGTNLSYLTYTYDADGNIASIADQMTPANTVNYGYDNVDRLSMVVSASTSATAQTYAYTKGTNRLATLTTSAGTRTVTYDGRGNTAKEVRPSAITATTAYDGYARLTGYTRTDVGAYTFSYNGLDDRVTMTNTANGTRTFVYDQQARVLGEYGASATDVKAEYIWALPSTGAGPFGGTDGVGGYAPLAVATPNSSGTIQLNWVFGNHLGVPLVTTDSTGALATTPNNYALPGFPGQSRVIADLYYNRYRDYDPITGRYIQGDPIGLAGGSNPFAYAEDNPLESVDPSGRAPYHAPVPLTRRRKDCPQGYNPHFGPEEKKRKACAQKAWSAANGTSLLLDALAIIPGGGDAADLARVVAAGATTVLGAVEGDGPAISASLAGGSVSIASLNRSELGKAAGEAIPFVGTFVGLYAVGHDIGNIEKEYNQCMLEG